VFAALLSLVTITGKVGKVYGVVWDEGEIKNRKFVSFFGLFWLVVRAILLDIETGDASDLLGWPICCVRDKGGTAIWWFGL